MLWSRSLEQLWARSQDTRSSVWPIIIIVVDSIGCQALVFTSFRCVNGILCNWGTRTDEALAGGRTVSWWQHSSQMLFTRLLMLECWSCVIYVAAEWLICFRAEKMSSVCFNAAHCCFSQKYVYNISQGFLHQKQNHFIFHDISFHRSLEVKAVFATVLLDLYAIEKTLKKYLIIVIIIICNRNCNLIMSIIKRNII